MNVLDKLFMLLYCLNYIYNYIEAIESSKVNLRRIKRVIGGENAQDRQAPWQVSLVKTSLLRIDTHVCGGALIGPKTVLTAAHCCLGRGNRKPKKTNFKVKFDGLDRTKLAQNITVASFTTHPWYHPEIGDYNYCLLTLSRSVTTSPTVKIIKITDRLPETGANAVLTGWGKTASGNIGSYPNKLKSVEINFISNSDCMKNYTDLGLTISMFCGTNPNGSACEGDDGGPLVFKDTLIGIAIGYDNRCPSDTTVRPNLFADANYQRNWIKSNIQ